MSTSPRMLEKILAANAERRTREIEARRIRSLPGTEERDAALMRAVFLQEGEGL